MVKCMICHSKTEPVKYTVDSTLHYCMSCYTKAYPIEPNNVKFHSKAMCPIDSCPKNIRTIYKDGKSFTMYCTPCAKKIYGKDRITTAKPIVKKDIILDNINKPATVVPEKTDHKVTEERLMEVLEEPNANNICPLPTCKETGCTNTPTKGHETDPWPIWCDAHAPKKGMKKIKITKHCKHPECDKDNAARGYEQKRPLYCADHNGDNLPEVTSPHCKWPNYCDKRPTHGPDGKLNQFCIEHAKEFTKITKLPTVTSNKGICQAEGCTNRHSFGKLGGSQIYCGDHRTKDMVNLSHLNDLCKHENCPTRARYGYPDDERIPVRCGPHKLDGMINVVDPQCVGTDCNNTASRQFKPFCFECYKKLNTNAHKLQNRGIKEKKIMEYLQRHINKPILRNSAVPNSGKKAKHPDGRIELPNRNIIIEIDEYQHRRSTNSYKDGTERIEQIFGGLEEKPLSVIRFNCDYYRINGVPQEGLFQLQDNFFVIADDDTFEREIQLLIQRIEEEINNNDTAREIKTIKLRYNIESNSNEEDDENEEDSDEETKEEDVNDIDVNRTEDDDEDDEETKRPLTVTETEKYLNDMTIG